MMEFDLSILRDTQPDREEYGSNFLRSLIPMLSNTEKRKESDYTVGRLDE